jgi:Ca2+-binding EF-hand superfamily protein
MASAQQSQLKAQLRRDPRMLLKIVCDEFRVHDKYQRGIISSSAFARVFSDLDLEYGSGEADQIMQFCTITDDGFVHYKQLMQFVAPRHAAAQSSIQSAIHPQHESIQDIKEYQGPSPDDHEYLNPTQRREFLAHRTDAIRRIYSEWDRGAITNQGFKEHMTRLGISIPEELHRSIDLHQSSRALSFNKVMQALQIGDFLQHKARDPDALASFTQPPDMYTTAQNRRNPINWTASEQMGQRTDVPTSNYDAPWHSDDMYAPVKSLICDYLAGSLPTGQFVVALQSYGVPMTQDLNRLLRQQQCDNRTTFRDYVKAIFPHRKDTEEQRPGMIASLAGVREQMYLPEEPEYVAGGAGACAGVCGARAAGVPCGGAGGAGGERCYEASWREDEEAHRPPGWSR